MQLCAGSCTTRIVLQAFLCHATAALCAALAWLQLVEQVIWPRCPRKIVADAKSYSEISFLQILEGSLHACRSYSLRMYASGESREDSSKKSSE